MYVFCFDEKTIFFMISIFMLALVRVELILLIIFLLSYAFFYFIHYLKKNFQIFFQKFSENYHSFFNFIGVLYYQSNLNLSLDFVFLKKLSNEISYYHEGDLSIKLNTYQIGSYNLLPITLDLFKSIMSLHYLQKYKIYFYKY